MSIEIIDPEIQGLRDELNPILVEGATALPDFDSATVFVAHASTEPENAAYAFQTHIGLAAAYFAAENIVRRGVDLMPMTPLKMTFENGFAPLTSSVLSHDLHRVWGAGIYEAAGLQTVLQIALNKNGMETSTDLDIIDYFKKHQAAFEKIMQTAVECIGDKPLDDTLAVQPPTTSNAVVIGADHSGSTRGFKRRTREVRSVFMETFADLGGRLATYNDNGNNYVVPLPSASRLTRKEALQYETYYVLPRLESLRKLLPGVRSHSQLGYVTKNQAGRDTSPVFGEIAKRLKR